MEFATKLNPRRYHYTVLFVSCLLFILVVYLSRQKSTPFSNDFGHITTEKMVPVTPVPEPTHHHSSGFHPQVDEVKNKKTKTHKCPFSERNLIPKDKKGLPPLPIVSKSKIRIRIESPWGAPIVWTNTEANVLARQPKGVFKVGLNIVAIAKYIKFLQPLITSADKFFMTDHNVTYFVISDHLDEVAKVKTHRHVVSIMEKSQGWPNNTLVRFQFINKHRDAYYEMDFLYQVDVDMKFVFKFNSEALGKRAGTLHPYFYTRQRRSFTYDRNPKSTAYVNRSEGEYYFAGGVFGGCRKEVITMADTIVKNILTDLRKYNYIALWHDESHLNRYFIDHPPTKILSPEYCYPEGVKWPIKQRLLALNKNKQEIRS